MDITQILQQLDQLFANHQIEKVERFLQEQIEVARQAGEVGNEITLLNELIGYYRDVSQYDNAIQMCKEAMELVEATGLKGTIPYATTLQNVANALRAAGQLDASKMYYETVFEVYQNQLPNNDMRYASLYNNMSLLYQEMGKFEQACISLESALAIAIQHEDAIIEVATTHTNLAMSLLKLNRLEEALKHLEQARDIFEQDEDKNYHYSATLCAMGEAYYLMGHLEESAQYYQQGMDEMERHVGRTSGYLVMQENLKAVQTQMKQMPQVQETYTSGMDLCEAFYEEYGIPMIREQFSDYENVIAVGLVGEGSDCFGFDDEYSKDHDFGPAFCMWLTDACYDEIGTQLQAAYEQLPTTYMGIQRIATPQASKRVGVLKISEFYERLIGTPEAPVSNQQWLYVEDERLAVATNGKVFRDDLGEFSRIRRDLLSYYPDEVHVQKIAREAALIAQSGQYNYGRMLLRGERVAARIALSEFMKHTMAMVYLLNREYAPFYKWMHKGMDRLTILPQIGGLLSTMEPLQLEDEQVMILIEQIAQMLIAQMKEQGLTKSNEGYLEHHTQAILLSVKETPVVKEELVDCIVKLEWEAFDQVQNIGRRADCQDDWETFSIMRKSQFLTWTEELLISYITDFRRANEQGWNLITEKYARMMASTDPMGYAEIAHQLPETTQRQKEIIEEIVSIQVNWMESFAKEYPKAAKNARSIRTKDDSMFNTSFETYLRGELYTYSTQTLAIYGTMVVKLVQAQKNLSILTISNTATLYGYASLEDMELKL